MRGLFFCILFQLRYLQTQLKSTHILNHKLNSDIFTVEIHGSFEVLLMVDTVTGVLHFVPGPDNVKRCVSIFGFLFRKLTKGLVGQLSELLDMVQNDMYLVGDTDPKLFVQC